MLTTIQTVTAQILPSITSTWAMVGMDILMIIYTLWIFSLSKPKDSRVIKIIGCIMAVWLVILYVGLSTKSIFAADISGVAMLAVIFSFVGLVGVAIFSFTTIRELFMNLRQDQLMFLQGIRVLFGATFLMQAGTGLLPLAFGIIDGYTHIVAGFVGLVAAYALVTNADGERRAWFANIWGLADILIVASTLALFLLPMIGAHHSMMYAVFFPAPLWFWLHVISIWKLVKEKK